MKMPPQKRGESSGDYQTPGEFIEAVERKFGPISFDLAASPGESVCPNYFSEVENSLIQCWSDLKGLLFLNPPYANIRVWAKKCAEEGAKKAHILLLTPASVSTNWFWDYVQSNAMVYCIQPRIRFVGAKDLYPKDLILSEFGSGLTGMQRWKW